MSVDRPRRARPGGRSRHPDQQTTHPPLSPREVAELSLTSRERGSGTREVLETALHKHGLTMGDSVVELTTATAIREAVLAGSSPAFLSRRVVARDLDSGHLVTVPTYGLHLKRTFRAVWVGTKQTPAGPVRELSRSPAQPSNRLDLREPAPTR